MTGSSLKSISPDSITGMIFAFEGMKNTIVLLNGPMGCRFYHSTTSQYMTMRPLLYVPAGEDGRRIPVNDFMNPLFFNQQRVPCTYLDGYDYVYGTRDKVKEALTYIKDNIDFDIIAIINSPGAALIGDNLLELAREVLGDTTAVMVESSGYSSTFEKGFSIASLALLSQVALPLWEKKMPEHDGDKTVNVFGISVWNRYQDGDIEELTRLFDLCGIKVNTFLCDGTDIESLGRMPKADLNVVLEDQMGLDSAVFMKEKCGTPYYVADSLPIGFKATEKIFTDVCSILGADPSGFIEESEKSRAAAWYRLEQIHRNYGKPKGVNFYVEGSPAQEKAYTHFLTQYLAMHPSEAEGAELVFSNANVISELMLKNRTFCGIEISLPGMGYVDIIPKTHMGLKGALFLVEQVINGIMSKL